MTGKLHCLPSDFICTCARPLADSFEEGENQKAVAATFAVLSHCGSWEPMIEQLLDSLLGCPQLFCG